MCRGSCNCQVVVSYCPQDDGGFIGQVEMGSDNQDETTDR